MNELELLKKKNFYLSIIIFCISSMLFGASLNYFVIESNSSCKMPVLSDYSFETNRHFSFKNYSEVRYFFLSDIINIGIVIISVGDVMLLSGAFISVVIIILYSINDYRIARLNKSRVRFYGSP